VSEERDAILVQILDLVAKVVTRVERLELAMAESAEMKLEIAELEARQAIERDQRRAVDDVLAEQLGGRLVEIKPRVWPKLIVDNDNRPEGGP
jgi:hypothetical protein